MKKHGKYRGPVRKEKMSKEYVSKAIFNLTVKEIGKYIGLKIDIENNELKIKEKEND